MLKNNALIKGILLILSILPSYTSFSQSDSLKTIEPKTVIAPLDIISAPEGFLVSEAFNGYLHPNTSTSMVLTLIENINPLQLAKGMNDDFFRQNQLTKTNEVKFTSDSGLNGIIYEATFLLNKIEMVRQIVYVGNLNKTLWISVTYPLEVETLVKEELLQSYKSVNLSKN